MEFALRLILTNYVSIMFGVRPRATRARVGVTAASVIIPWQGVPDVSLVAVRPVVRQRCPCATPSRRSHIHILLKDHETGNYLLSLHVLIGLS